MPNFGSELVLTVTILVGAVAGWQIWSKKGRIAWHGAVVGGLLGFFWLLGWLVLAAIYFVWHPATEHPSQTP